LGDFHCGAVGKDNRCGHFGDCVHFKLLLDK
jgi:hypothetical protein